MDMCTNYFSNASCQKIPDDNSAIITANCKQRAPPVKGASQGHADTIQSSISFLKIKRTQNTDNNTQVCKLFCKGSLLSMDTSLEFKSYCTPQ